MWTSLLPETGSLLDDSFGEGTLHGWGSNNAAPMLGGVSSCRQVCWFLSYFMLWFWNFMFRRMFVFVGGGLLSIWMHFRVMLQWSFQAPFKWPGEEYAPESPVFRHIFIHSSFGVLTFSHILDFGRCYGTWEDNNDHSSPSCSFGKRWIIR